MTSKLGSKLLERCRGLKCGWVVGTQLGELKVQRLLIHPERLLRFFALLGQRRELASAHDRVWVVAAQQRLSHFVCLVGHRAGLVLPIGQPQRTGHESHRGEGRDIVGTEHIALEREGFAVRVDGLIDTTRVLAQESDPAQRRERPLVFRLAELDSVAVESLVVQLLRLVEAALLVAGPAVRVAE